MNIFKLKAIVFLVASVSLTTTFIKAAQRQPDEASAIVSEKESIKKELRDVLLKLLRVKRALEVWEFDHLRPQTYAYTSKNDVMILHKNLVARMKFLGDQLTVQEFNELDALARLDYTKCYVD